MKQALWLERFIKVYSELGTRDFEVLNSIYHPDVEFKDPMHRITGADHLIDYFESIYTNVNSCQFDIHKVIESEDEAALYWNMSYQHKKLNGGKTIVVEGHSHLIAKDGLVIFHRDYLDAGAMVYEHVPLLGSVIRSIKNRMSDV